jgi:hypothetical protein
MVFCTKLDVCVFGAHAAPSRRECRDLSNTIVKMWCLVSKRLRTPHQKSTEDSHLLTRAMQESLIDFVLKSNTVI